MRTLCLGEALVDLVCEHPVSSPAEADAFVPYFGGAAANVAVTAARHGADIALLGGVGDDAWGEWLWRGLGDAGVALDWFELAKGLHTPVAFVTTDHDGEPDFQVYGEAISVGLMAAVPHLDEALASSDALFFSSNTLVGEDERAQTMRAREAMLEDGRPVLFDPNLRLRRWPAVQEAVEAARACIPGAFLVKANRAEAQLLTGEPDPEGAARGLVGAGARLAVVTLGEEGAILRGEFEGEATGVPARVVSTVGAGDAFSGVLLARLAASGFYPPAAAAALPEAVAEGARTTERWGAVA